MGVLLQIERTPSLVKAEVAVVGSRKTDSAWVREPWSNCHPGNPGREEDWNVTGSSWLMEQQSTYLMKMMIKVCGRRRIRDHVKDKMRYGWFIIIYVVLMGKTVALVVGPLDQA